MCATPARHRASRMDESDPERGFWAARDLIEGTGKGRSARHARKVPSRYALHIGRVGALAVSLGVGLAVANSSGVAYADADPESVSSEANADADSPSAGPGKPSEPSADETNQGASEDNSEAGESDEDPASADDPGDADEQDPDTDDDPGTTEPDGPDEPEATVPEAEEEAATPPPPEAPTEEPSVPPANSDDTPAVPPATDDPTETRESDEPDVVSDESAVGDDELESEPAGVIPPAEDGGLQTDVVAVDVVGTDSTDDLASAAPPAEETVNIVAALVSSVVSPFADPEAPAQAPWLDALLAWVRRQIDHTFFNKTPVAGAVTTEQILTGQVLVTIPAYDPNGDPLTYTIVQPTNGLVFRDLITGKFVYTPTSIVTDPTTVTFQVKINDSSEHLTGGLGAIQNVLHVIARLFGLAQTDNLTVPVTFTINPLVQLPPSVVTIGTPTFKLGGSPVKVVSSATITDLDSDHLLSATIKIATAGKAADILEYTAPSGVPITATWNAATKTLTLTGKATVAQYEAAIEAVTFSTTEGGLPRGLLISVSDDDGVGSLVPGAALVTVIGLPPIVTTIGLPIFKLGGSPVKVVSSATITDLDSDELSSATVTIATGGKAGDVLGYVAPSGISITGSWNAETKTLTLTGVASVADYEAAIKAVTFSTTEGGLARGVSISVTDSADVESLVPGAALVTVIGLPPIVTTIGLPIFKLGGSPVKVISSVTITDLDSDELSSAMVTIATGGKTGDVLGYVAQSGVPITASWDAETRTLTMSGVATKAQYEQALKAVTFSTTEGGLARGVSISVTDSADVESLVPGAALVSVIGLPPIVTTIGLPIFKLGGSPVKVISSVTITDLDSDELSSATVTIATGGKAGDVLGYVAQSGVPIAASWNAETQTLTLSGVATKAQYEQALKAVTFSTTEGGLARGVSVSVTDDADVESLVPGAALVSVIGLPPIVTTIGTPIFKLGGSPVKVVSSVSITDLDSDEISSATVTIATGGKAGDVLGYVALSGNPITGVWDAETRTLTLTGVASVADYEAAIKAVTFTTTEGGLARGISISVTDDADVESLVPGAALVSVIGLPPIVTTIGTPIFKLGGSPVKVISSVSITDLDSDELSSATVTIATGGKAGDVLNFVQIGGNPITASWNAATRTLTLSGVATKAQYEAALKAVTFTTTEGGVARGVSVSVTDDANVQSLVPGAALVSVIGLPPMVTTLGTPIFKLGGSPVKVISSVSITDLDSDELSRATITIASAGQSGDVLGYTAPNGNPITASWDAATQTLTLSGVATKAQYEAAIKAVTFTTNQGGLARGISISVTDEANVNSIVSGSAIVSVVGLPPAVATLGASTHTIGTAPVQLLSSVSISDADSTNMSKASVKITSLGQSGDVLGYVAPVGNPITATWDANSRTLTLSGVATKAQYEEALEAVTFSATGGALIVRGVSVWVTDDTDVESLIPGGATANVRYSLAPSVTTVGVATHTIGAAPVKLLSSANIEDLDSTYVSQATVKIATLAQSGDKLGYVQPSGNPITAQWDDASKTLTLSGVATKAQYEEALKAVTFSATGGVLIVRGIVITASDDTGITSGLLTSGAATAGARNPSPPTLLVAGARSYDTGDPPMNPVASVSISDSDSDNMSSATLKVTSFARPNDRLAYVQPAGNPITATVSADGKTLTLSGAGTKAQYEAAIKAVTFYATDGGWTTRSITVFVTDDAGVSSATGFVTVSVW